MDLLLVLLALFMASNPWMWAVLFIIILFVILYYMSELAFWIVVGILAALIIAIAIWSSIEDAKLKKQLAAEEEERERRRYKYRKKKQTLNENES